MDNLNANLLRTFVTPAKALAPRSTVKQDRTMLSFAMIPLGKLGAKAVMWNVLPVSMLQPGTPPKIDTLDGAPPLYRVAARDGSVAEVLVGYAPESGQAKNVKAPFKPRLLDAPFVFTVGAPMAVYIPNADMPEPMSLVMAINCRVNITTNADGSNGMLFTARAIDKTLFASFNALPMERRVAALFAGDMSMRRLPPVMKLMEQRETARALAERYALPLPVTLLSLNRDYTSGEEYSDMPLVLPETGMTPDETRLHKVYVAQRPREFARKKGEPASTEPWITSYEFDLVQWQLSADATARESFMVADLRFRSEAVQNMGTIVPLQQEALLQTNPLPAFVLGSLDPKATLDEPKNESKARQGYEDGVARMKVNLVCYRTLEYLIHCAIPVSLGGAVKARFGDRMVPYEPGDYDQTTGELQLGNGDKLFKRPALKNPFAPGADPSLVACDALPMKSGKFPSEEHYAYFAVPMSKNIRVPMEEVVADEYDMDGTTRREIYHVCAIKTPEDGDAFVLGQRGANPSKEELRELGEQADHAPWLLPKPNDLLKDKRVPKFLFFAVHRDVIKSWNQPITELDDLQRPKPDLYPDDALLPANLHDYMIRMVRTIAADDPIASYTTTLGDDDDDGEDASRKRRRADLEEDEVEEEEEVEDDDAVTEGGEPARKRTRLDS